MSEQSVVAKPNKLTKYVYVVGIIPMWCESGQLVMASYQYQALDSAGRTKHGVLQADTERQVADQLQAKGLVPLLLERHSQPVSPAQKPAHKKTGCYLHGD